MIQNILETRVKENLIQKGCRFRFFHSYDLWQYGRLPAISEGVHMILCYIYEGMADFEITLLLHRLKNQGNKEILSIASSYELMTAQSGLRYKPDKLIAELTDLTKVEALIIPGGPINNNQNDICNLIKVMVKEEKLVGAICFAPQFLGRAGILKAYKYTTSCSEDTIQRLRVEDPFYRPNYREARVVKDRNIITAKGHAFIDFSMAVCGYLNIYESEEQLHEYFKPLKDKE